MPRRSISVKGETYTRLKKHCEEDGVTLSGVVESLILGYLGGIEDGKQRAAADQATQYVPPRTIDEPPPKNKFRLNKDPLPPAEEKKPRGGGTHSF